MENDAQVVIDAFVEAYNAKDFARLEDLVADDVHVLHHNRGVEANNRKELFGLFEAFGAAFPDRAFSNRRHAHPVGGDTVVVEHTWGGTAAGDVPGFAAAGEKVSLDLCTVATVRDGQIVEYHDYG